MQVGITRGVSDPKIIYEDSHIIAVNKPAGLLTHGTSRDARSVAHWLVSRFPSLKTIGDDPERPGIVHRLDRDTSGVLLIARTQESFQFLKHLFRQRRMKKTYRVIVCGVLPRSGIIEKSIGRKTGSVRQSVFSNKAQKEAITEYKTIGRYQNMETNERYSMALVYPKTGRTHQIRVHFASIGHPVAGDRLYGGKRTASAAPRQMLHAEAVEFSDENGHILRIAAEPPDDFHQFIERLQPEN